MLDKSEPTVVNRMPIVPYTATNVSSVLSLPVHVFTGMQCSRHSLMKVAV